MKFTISFRTLLSTALAFALPLSAVAYDSIKEEKRARSNDVADRYILERDGDFFREVRGKPCQITNNVDDFKVSQHRNDAAMVYFIKDGDLYVLHNAESSGQCPKASKKVIMPNVKKYNVVSNTNTTIVNTALDRSGTFIAWDNTRDVLTVRGVDEYKLNQCFGTGRSFSSYVAFLLSRSGDIYKVKGNEPEKSKWDNSRDSYNTLNQFEDRQRVCQ
ncbi:MAG: hypothetical protein AB1540_09440 [Bdellovibrionota bacterium]